MTDLRCEVRLLGGIGVVFFDGREEISRFRTRKAAWLLASLALRPGQALTREALIERLWPDLDEAAGRDNLSTALSQLKRQLGPAIFLADHTTIRLDPALVSTDIQKFERLVARRTHTSLTEALALFGEPLPGIYDDWAADEQNRLSALADQSRALLERLPAPEVSSPLSPALSEPAETLPRMRSSSVGRDALLSSLQAQLPESRLWTLLGPGGVGKTHLSLALARQSSAFECIVFVGLAEIPSPLFLMPALRRALKLPPPAPGGLTPLDEIVGQLSQAPTLLLLDNLEHLIPPEPSEKGQGAGLEGLVGCLLDRCPRLTILTTSRQPLGLDGERLWPVPPLVPEAALELFVARARAARPDFTLHAGNSDALVRLCTLLEGLPLAIELAAGWARLLSPESLAERVEKEAHRLEGRRRDTPERQQSLQATLFWSWRLLTEAQKAALARLAAFRGGFTPELAGKVLLQGEADTLELLASLEERSLLVAQPERGRLRFLEPLRAFALDRLAERGETDATMQRLSEALFTLARDVSDGAMTPDSLRLLDRQEAEIDNVRVALGWCLENAPSLGRRLGGSLWQFWEMRGHLDEGQSWFDRLIALAPGPKEGDEETLWHAHVLSGSALLALRQGDYAEVERLAGCARHVYREQEKDKEENGAAHLLCTAARHTGNLVRARELLEEQRVLVARLDVTDKLVFQNSAGLLAQQEGDHVLARKEFEACIKAAREIGSSQHEVGALNNLGASALACGEIALAEASHRRARKLGEELGYPRVCFSALYGLGNVARETGQFVESGRYFLEALRTSCKIAFSIGVMESLAGLAILWLKMGRTEDGIRLFGAVDRQREARGMPFPSSFLTIIDAARATAPDRFDALWQAGRQLTPGDACQWACESLGAER